MSSGKNTNLISRYANGNNDLNKTYTVISKDSYFNMIDLAGGYISWKYAMEKLVNNENLSDETQLPVFYLKKVLAFYGICHKTWMYFGVINGDYDLQLNRNNKYLLSKKINTRIKDFNFDLIYHLKENESKYIDSNFSDIRKAYDQEDLKKVDKLIEKFEMKTNQDTKNDKFYNDFDKSIEIFKTLNLNYLNCLIEDPNELTCYSIVQKNNVFNMIYYLLTNKFNLKRISTIEYYRNQNLSKFEDSVFKQAIKIDKPENSLIYDFLKEINEKLTDRNNNVLSKDDNLSILMTSLSIWYEWILKNNYKTKISISPEIFVDSILTNLLIIDLKNKLQSNQNDKNIGSDSEEKNIIDIKLCVNNINEINRMINIYNQIINHDDTKLSETEFFLNDIKIVHRLNEFQTMFFSLCLLSKISDFKLDYFSPRNFFNGRFLFEYINKTDNETIQTIINIQNKIDHIKLIKDNLKKKFREYHRNLFEMADISSKLDSVKI